MLYNQGVTGVALFILPMRNWNYGGHKAVHKSGFLFLYYLWGIEILISSIKAGRSFDSFYITYEELKYDRLTRGFQGGRLLFILPMRNWNVKDSLFSLEERDFLYYLWGIEMMIVLRFFIPNMNFLYYLWGIEISYK